MPSAASTETIRLSGIISIPVIELRNRSKIYELTRNSAPPRRCPNVKSRTHSPHDFCQYSAICKNDSQQKSQDKIL